MKDILELKSEFPEVYKFITENNLQTLKVGSYQLDNGVYVNIDSYETSAIDVRKYETHKKYIDIQYIISGREKIYITEIKSLKPESDYDETKDIQFFGNSKSDKSEIVETGDYIIIKPLVAHMPCVYIDKPELVKKAVFKYPVVLMK